MKRVERALAEEKEEEDEKGIENSKQIEEYIFKKCRTRIIEDDKAVG